MLPEDMTRFDTRLPKSQKELFEQAARLGGFRSLTDFILQAAQTKAQEIVAEHERVLASARDQALFFDALMQPAAPNEALKTAAALYQQALRDG
ncbi:MAG: DUF1778 domain-containing protein [Bacteroidota bacterium]